MVQTSDQHHDVWLTAAAVAAGMDEEGRRWERRRVHYGPMFLDDLRFVLGFLDEHDVSYEARVVPRYPTRAEGILGIEDYVFTSADDLTAAVRRQGVRHDDVFLRFSCVTRGAYPAVIYWRAETQCVQMSQAVHEETIALRPPHNVPERLRESLMERRSSFAYRHEAEIYGVVLVSAIAACGRLADRWLYVLLIMLSAVVVGITMRPILRKLTGNAFGYLFDKTDLPFHARKARRARVVMWLGLGAVAALWTSISTGIIKAYF